MATAALAYASFVSGGASSRRAEMPSNVEPVSESSVQAPADGGRGKGLGMHSKLQTRSAEGGWHIAFTTRRTHAAR